MRRDEQSRRAFALDSRTVWVEQQNVKGMVVSVENTPLGPGEYNPGMRPNTSRHVSTPSLGKRSVADSFKPFRSTVSRGGIDAPYSIDSYSAHDPESLARENRSLSRESSTIFHDTDRRQPYRLDRAETPGSYVGPSNIFSPVRFDGGKGQIRPVTFPQAPLDICPVTPAGETYAVNYSVVERKLIEPKIFPGERFSYNKKRQPKIPRVETQIPFAKRPVSPFRERQREQHITIATPAGSIAASEGRRNRGLAQGSSVSDLTTPQVRAKAKAGTVTKMKLGSRTSRFGGALIFDASSYDRLRKAPPLALTPGTIARKAKVNPFRDMLTVRHGILPQSLSQPSVGSLISEKIKRVRGMSSRDSFGN